MIKSFRNEATREVYETGRSRKFGAITRAAVRRLNDLQFAVAFQDLRIPPSNRLEKLRGDREGQYSIRINDQYRVCFRWERDGAADVEITGYH